MKNSSPYLVDSNLYTVISSPPCVGYYQIGGQYGLRIAFSKKPIWLHRKMMFLCLGWMWIDA
jgi:hypothetical protein